MVPSMDQIYREWWDEDGHTPPTKLFGPRFGVVLALCLVICFLLVLLLCVYALLRRGPRDERI